MSWRIPSSSCLILKFILTKFYSFGILTEISDYRIVQPCLVTSVTSVERAIKRGMFFSCVKLFQKNIFVSYVISRPHYNLRAV